MQCFAMSEYVRKADISDISDIQFLSRAVLFIIVGILLIIQWRGGGGERDFYVRPGRLDTLLTKPFFNLK